MFTNLRELLYVIIIINANPSIHQFNQPDQIRGTKCKSYNEISISTNHYSEHWGALFLTSNFSQSIHSTYVLYQRSSFILTSSPFHQLFFVKKRGERAVLFTLYQYIWTRRCFHSLGFS